MENTNPRMKAPIANTIENTIETPDTIQDDTDSDFEGDLESSLEKIGGGKTTFQLYILNRHKQGLLECSANNLLETPEWNNKFENSSSYQ